MFRDKAERHEIESRAVDYRQPDRTLPIRARLSQHPAFQRMIYQKQGHRLRGMIDRSHQPTSEVALYNKLKALAYWIR